MKDKVGTILQATIRHNKTRGVQDICSFLGACNFYRRHVPNFRYSSHLLTDRTRKNKKWHWGEEEAKQFQELKEKLGNVGMLGTCNSEGELLVITDPSLVGGRGTLFQWQKVPDLVLCTVAEEPQKMHRISLDGTLKQNYDPPASYLLLELDVGLNAC